MKKRSALIFGLLAVLLAFSVVLAGCDAPNKDDGGGGGGGTNQFVGTWNSSAGTLTFRADLTATYSAGPQSGTYTHSGNTATLTLSTNPSNPYPATINGQGKLNCMGVEWTKQTS